MKKISQIVAYTLLGIVVIGLILSAVLKKDFAPNISIPSYVSGGVEISEAGLAKYDGLSDKDNYNRFVNEYNNSFKLTILYSVFSGKISREQNISNYGKTSPSLYNGFVVTFNYPENQVLKTNGTIYHEATNSDDEVLFKKVFFAVESDKGLTAHKIYFYSEANSAYYELETLANFDSLYNLIRQLPMFAEQD